ncbi:MAG: MFS transporter [Nitrospirota bacterium]|nr:MFS transporter [Nitrospirota bacterium]
MSSSSSKNLLIFTTVSSIWATIMGLIGPFYVVYVAELSNGMEKLGLAFSIMILVQSATTYFAGRYSDKLGRKIFLFITAYTDASILFLYTLINSTHELYILQALLGITNGIVGTVGTSLLGDLTVRARRGRMVGKYNAIVSLSSAIGLFFSGYLVKAYGIKSLFYLASIVVALSTVFLFFMEEEKQSESEKIYP